MTGKVLAKQFSLNEYVIQVNLDGVAHADGLRQPTVGGNCINWVLGHIVATRNSLFKLLGGEPVWCQADAERYRRGSPPIRQGEDALPLERLRADLVASQSRLLPLLEKLSEAELALRKEGEEDALAEQLAMLAFHESYHAGQIGLLRRVIGLAGAIQ